VSRYADRGDHYWAGYFTSRPYTKRMGRRLQALLRETDIRLAMATSIAHVDTAVILRQVKLARRELGLFQHHDAITGTSKDFVMRDYAHRMLASIIHLDAILAGILTNADAGLGGPELRPLVRHASLMQTPFTEILPVSQQRHRVVFTNSLAYERRQAVELRVDVAAVIVQDVAGAAVPSQVDPVYGYRTAREPAAREHALWFEVVVPPLGTASYTVAAAQALGPPQPGAATLAVSSTRDAADTGTPIVLSNSHMALECDPESGLLSSITPTGSAQRIDVAVEFRVYRARPVSNGGVSGAYLFLPQGNTQPYQGNGTHLVRVTTGAVTSSVTVVQQHFRHTVRVFHSSAAYAAAPVFDNLVDVGIFEMVKVVAPARKSNKVVVAKGVVAAMPPGADNGGGAPRARKDVGGVAHHRLRHGAPQAHHGRKLLSEAPDDAEGPGPLVEAAAPGPAADPTAKPKPKFTMRKMMTFADRELVMRIKTGVRSEDRFVTDLNGFQVFSGGCLCPVASPGDAFCGVGWRGVD